MEVLQEQLQSIAEIHAEASGGLLTVLDLDMERYPGQNLEERVIKGAPIGPSEANSIANGIDGRYDSLFTATDNHVALQQIANTLRSGQNAIIATGHGELIDIALQSLAVANAIRIAHPQTDKKGRPFFRTGLIVSKMVDYLGIDSYGAITPVRDLFSLGFEKTYLTIPSTVSSKNLIQRGQLKYHNNVVKREIAADLQPRAFSNRRPMLLSVAAPGTLDKQLDTARYNGPIPAALRERTMVMGQINYSMTEFAKNALTYAAIAKLSMASRVNIDPTALCLQSPQDIETLARHLLTLAQAEAADEAYYVYDADGNLPVVRKK